MRIVYLVEWDAFKPDGVLKKVKMQVEAWESCGEEVGTIFVSPARTSGRPAVLPQDSTILYEFPRTPRFAAKARKYLLYASVESDIKRLSPDLVYMRQSSWSPGVMTAVGRSAKLVVEFNTRDVEESVFRSKPAALFHILTRQIVLRRADAFVAVSDELARDLEPHGKPIAVIANGINLDGIGASPPPVTARPQLIFIGTPGLPWHGTDILISLAGQLPEFDFHVVGPSVQKASPNLIGHGYLGYAEVEELLKTMDVGIGTLALSRKGMTEASPLKSRQYLAAGLPVIGAYKDTDVDGSDFYLSLPSSGICLEPSISSVRKFVRAWKGRRVEREKIRPLIDSRFKESQRLAFFDSIVGK